MKPIRSVIIFALVFIIVLLGVWLFVSVNNPSIVEHFSDSANEQQHSNQNRPSVKQSVLNKPKEPISIENKSINEILCLLGEPQEIETQEHRPWVFFFKGPFITDSENPSIAQYAEILINLLTPYELNNPTIFYHDEILRFGEPVNELPEALKRLYVNALPKSEKQLIQEFGEWTKAYSRGKNKKRVIYDRPTCFGGKPYKGFAVTLESQNVVGGKALETHQRLARALHNLRTYREEDEYFVSSSFQKYGSEPVARDGAVDTLLTYVVSREFHEIEKAKEMLVSDVYDAEMRFYLETASFDHETLIVNTLEYKIAEVTEQAVAIDIRYQLSNDFLAGGRYSMVKEHDQWKVARYLAEQREQIFRKNKLISKIPPPSSLIYIPDEVDSDSVLYLERKPIENSPQEAVVHFLMHREANEFELAAGYISKTVHNWARKSLLRRHSPDYGQIDISTLRYQLKEIKNGVYDVNYSLNWENKTYMSGSLDMILEEGRWKIK